MCEFANRNVTENRYCLDFLSKLLASLMRNNFRRRQAGAPLHTLSKLYDVPVGFVTPSLHLRQCIALFEVAEGWLLLDIG